MGGGLSFVVRLAQATKGKASPLSRARGVTDRFSGRRPKRPGFRRRRGTAPPPPPSINVRLPLEQPAAPRSSTCTRLPERPRRSPTLFPPYDGGRPPLHLFSIAPLRRKL